MQIVDGQWLIREGLELAPCAFVHDVQVRGRTLEVVAATRDVSARSAQQDGPLLAVRISSPRTGVVAVRVAHFEGAPEARPAFALAAQEAPDAEVSADAAGGTLRTGGLTVRVARGPGGGLDIVRGGARLTGVAPKGQGWLLDRTTGRGHAYARLGLAAGEAVYGLGERFTAFVKNGQSVEIWNRDGGTATAQAYKNVPFYLSSRGYGVFVNHPGRVSFEVASELVNAVQFSVEGEALEYLVIDGPTPKEVLERYTALTGRPALPPAWSFGLWLSTSFNTSYDEATVSSFVEGMRERRIPLSVFHFDCFWMRPFHWCDFEWDPAVFPDPAGMLARLRARGLRVCVWINPYVAQRSALFAEGKEKGYLLRRPDGRVWQWDRWQPGMAIVDFTNPAACRWWTGHLRRLLATGVDCFKTDFGERIPTEVVWHDGSDPERMHNQYAQLYNRLVFELLREVRGEGEAVVFARAATAGGQQFPVHWGGDCTATYESMAESLRGGLSLGLSGFGFWSHDIGGFEQTAPAHLYKRWCAFGLLSSHSRLHGNHSVRVPWAFDEEAVEVLRDFTRLKCRLMPYLWDAAAHAAASGVPMMRAMVLEFPDDPACRALDLQYMLGDALLVAPVFREDGEVDVYLPPGRWTRLLTGEVVTGGAWRRERHGFRSLPLYVREGTLLAWGRDDGRPDFDHADGVELQLFPLADGAAASATVRDLRGKPTLAAAVARHGQRLSVALDGNARGCTLLLRGVAALRSAPSGLRAERTERGVLVALPPGCAAAELEV
ncbi:MAG TPA: alpha-xylosidase [Anaeromyxobacter sp.]|nr:alpha-xylosidase [Anaeromyxobacter sp.]